jgi:hypothetical protein
VKLALKRLAELMVHREDLDEPWFESLRGRLVEVSAHGATATLTAAFGLVAESQRMSEPVAWITGTENSFFPPDVIANGIDLTALAVVQIPSTAVKGFAITATRVVERLLRSNGFGLIVMDLTGGEDAHPLTAAQGRLSSLVKAHRAAVVCLTTKSEEAPSLGSVVSLHATALREYDGKGHFVTIRALKDKRCNPSWTRNAKARGPMGF